MTRHPLLPIAVAACMGALLGGLLGLAERPETPTPGGVSALTRQISDDPTPARDPGHLTPFSVLAYGPNGGEVGCSPQNMGCAALRGTQTPLRPSAESATIDSSESDRSPS